MIRRFSLSELLRVFSFSFILISLLLVGFISKEAIFPPSSAAVAANVPSTPVVDVQVAGAEIPKTTLLGEQFCYTARLANSGDTGPGFTPYLRLVTPPGVTLASASLLSVGNNGVGTESSSYTFTPAVPTAVGTLPINDPLSNTPAPGTSGHTLWIIQPPIGSIHTGQSPIDIRICLRVGLTVTPGTPLPICHQPIYLNGTGVYGNTSVAGDIACDPVTPLLVKFQKRAPNAAINDNPNGPPLEVASGFCHSIDFELVADIANGVELTDVIFKDTFSTYTDNNGAIKPHFVLVTTSPVTVNGLNTGVVVTPLGGLTGFEVATPGKSYTGSASADDIVVRFQAYAVNQINEAPCETREVSNTGMLNAKYLGASIPSQTDQLRFEMKKVAMQKMAMPQQAVPGEMITYAVKFQVATDEIAQYPKIIDFLPDGVSYVPGSAMLGGYINNQNVNTPILLTEPLKEPQTDGSTKLTFGDLGNTFQFGKIGACTRAVLTYKGIINQTYNPPKTNQSVLAADRLENRATIEYTKFNSQIPCAGEGAAARVTIKPVEMVTKAIMNNPLPAEFKPGEEVLFSLKMCLPSGDAKSITIKDYLPAPIFNASDVNVASIVSFTKTPANVTAALTGPAVSTTDNSVSFTIMPDPFTSNVNQPVCFEILFKARITMQPLPEKISVTNYLQVETTNSAGEKDSHEAGVVLTVSSPRVTVTKSVCEMPGIDGDGNLSGVDAGDKITFCVTAKNEGTAPAYSVKIIDVVPPSMTYVASSLVQVGTTPTVLLNALAPATTGLEALAPGLNPGESFTIRFMATLNNTVAPCETYTNKADIRWSADSGMPPPTNSIVTGISDTATVTIAKPTFTKTAGSSTAAIGDTITYELKVCLPEGTSPSFTVSDVFPSANLLFGSVSLQVPTGMIVSPSTITGKGPWSFNSALVPGDNDPGNNCFTITVKGTVKNDPVNQNNTPIKNEATLTLAPCGPFSSEVITTVIPPPCVDPSLLTNMANLIGWWPLDEPNGATVIKDIAKAYNGKPKPGPTVNATGPASTPGTVATSLGFTAASYVEVPDNTDLDIGINDLTIDAWVFTDGFSPTTGQTIVNKLDTTSGLPRGYSLTINGIGKLVFSIAGVGSGLVTYTSGQTLSTTGWKFVAVTVKRNPSQVNFYVDNTISTFTTPTVPTGSLANTKSLRIGGGNAIRIDELEIFNVALATDKIDLIRNANKAGKCKDKTCLTNPVKLPAKKLKTGVLGKAYLDVIPVTGGVGPYKFEIIGGNLPSNSGLNLDMATGALSGIPSICNTVFFPQYALIIKVTDSRGCMATQKYTLKVSCFGVSFDYDVSNSSGAGVNEDAAAKQNGTMNLSVIRQAEGNERSMSFSISYDPALLTNPVATPGSGAAGATIALNTTQAAQGKLGLVVTLPGNRTLAEGPQQVARLSFGVLRLTLAPTTRIEFSDTPTPRRIVDANGNVLQTQYENTPVVLAPKVTCVSAANYMGDQLAADQIVAAFGTNLATGVQAATGTLSTSLLGTTVTVKDSAGVDRPALIFFVAPTQVNYLLPAGVAPGAATVIIASGNGSASGGVIQIASVAPGIFTADATGRGVPAANLLRVRPDGSLTTEPVGMFDPSQGKFIPKPIDFGPEGDRLFLVLYATAIKGRNSLSDVQVTIGNYSAEVLYAGPQGSLFGLDQLNIEIPRSLTGQGLVDVVVIVNGVIANIVQINFE